MELLTIQNSTLALTAALTGAGLVWLALWLAGLISPRSFNPRRVSLMNVVSPPAARVWHSLKWAIISLLFCF